ncbi:hypothetical protein F5Y15DRAFT_403561 [Xylariaceae sp. FL0016]|nr:hypothetical protein F5Y15DRAFT_403561 [Xylariaceae sp. FL0016]
MSVFECLVTTSEILTTALAITIRFEVVLVWVCILSLMRRHMKSSGHLVLGADVSATVAAPDFVRLFRFGAGRPVRADFGLCEIAEVFSAGVAEGIILAWKWLAVVQMLLTIAGRKQFQAHPAVGTLCVFVLVFGRLVETSRAYLSAIFRDKRSPAVGAVRRSCLWILIVAIVIMPSTVSQVLKLRDIAAAAITLEFWVSNGFIRRMLR